MSDPADDLSPRTDPERLPAPPRRSHAELMLVAAALAIVAAIAGAYYFAVRPVTLRIAVGPPNSDDVRVVEMLAHTFTREGAHVRLRPVITEGSRASAEAVGIETSDLAVVRGDGELPKNALTVATLRKNVAVLWVPAAGPGQPADGPAISHIENLAGRRIAIVGRAPGNLALLRLILQHYAVDPDRVAIAQLGTAGLADALSEARADAFLAVGPLNSKVIAEAIAATSPHGRPTFLPIDAAEAIAQRHPTFEAAEIPAGIFGAAPARPGNGVKTLSFSHHIVARQSLSDATVAALARQLFAARQAVLAEYPQSVRLETPDTDKDAAASVHPGAAAYVDGEEQSFLDRYSDYIWWSVMAASGLGSLGAWFVGYLRRDDRTFNASLRTRLLGLLAEARACDDIDALDRMQAEGDDILRRTLDQYDHGVIDEGDLAAFAIALEQFHNAVADRKLWLATVRPRSHDPGPPLSA